MQKKKSNRWEIAFAIFMLVLGVFVVMLGTMFCYSGVTQIVSIGDVDVNVLLRNPADYMTSKRDIAMGGLEVLVPGVVLLIMGAVILAVSITRAIVLAREGRAILRLEQRIEKLESGKNATGVTAKKK